MSSDREQLTEMDPELEALLKNSPPSSIRHDMDVLIIRSYMRSIQRDIRSPNVNEEDRLIPMRDGAHITIRIYKPKDLPAEGRPVFVVYHGGGFCLGGLASEAGLCRRWVEYFGGIAVNVHYRLAPEYPFPTPINDAFDALIWVAANLESLDADPKKGFVIGGVSAGANFSIVLSHLYRDGNHSPPLTGLYLAVPSVLLPDAVPEKCKAEYLSRSKRNKDPFLTHDTEAYFMKHYKPDPASPLASPILFPTGHKDLPPAYFQICGLDMLRDELFLYERILREECGVKTKVDFYTGLPHGFWAYFPTARFTKKHEKDSINGLSWLLAQSSQSSPTSTKRSSTI